MATAIDVQSTLLQLAEQLTRGFANYDHVKGHCRERDYDRQSLELVKRWRNYLDEIADAIEECARLAPEPPRADLFDAAVRLRNLDRAVPRMLTDAVAALVASDATSERTADKKTDNEKKLPPNPVNECARYIRAQRKLIEEGKRLKAAKKALIAEHIGSDDTAAMERELQPSRYGWLLYINGQADK